MRRLSTSLLTPARRPRPERSARPAPAATTRQVAVNHNPVETVVDKEQQAAKQLGEDVHRLAPATVEPKPDRAKLCATAAGFEFADEIRYIQQLGPPRATDASSPPISLSCSRPKAAMLGSSTPPITSPHGSPATATRYPSPSRKPTPASKLPGPATIGSMDRPSSTPIAKAAASPP